MSHHRRRHEHPTTIDAIPFVKQVKNIGRAYRKQARELVACLEHLIPALKCRSAELRNVSKLVDDALSSAVRASKAASQGVDNKFDAAVRALGKYEERFDPNSRSVIRRMEEAKAKDTSSVKALTKLEEKQPDDDWSASPKTTKTVNITLFGHSKVQAVSMDLDPRSSFSEIIWRLGRHRDRGRITPGQHPFFYQDLPVSREKYDKDFKTYPIEDFQAVFNHNVYVLIDQPGRVFIQSDTTRKRTFGNVWMPKDTLIFKDVFGTLMGERVAGLVPQVTPDVHFWHLVDSSRALAFSTSPAGVSPVTRSSQPDITTGPGVNHNPSAAEPAVSWRELVLQTWNSHDINVFISTISTILSPSSAENWVLPPQQPAAKRPGQLDMDTLNDDVLFSIFGSYRLDDDENWNLQLRWCKLVHVCRRWRHLVYESPAHLNLHLLCTNGTPVADMLKHSPPLPLILNYQSPCATMTFEDEQGILLALQHRKRVRRVVLHAPSQGLDKFLTALNEDFPTLERLSVSSTSDDDVPLVMPRKFKALRLSHLTLLGVTLSTAPRSLASTISLVTLVLTYPRASSYFSPEDLATQLQFVPLLEELSISLSVPIRRPRIQMHPRRIPMTSVTLPALKRFVFRGLSAYLEGLLDRISAPCLAEFDVTLFNQLLFALPALSRFINATAAFRLPVANVNFNPNSISISVSNHEEAQGDRSLYLQVSCKPFDWQVNSATQICRELREILPTVEELSLNFHKHGMPHEWRNGVVGGTWYEFLMPFEGVKKLRVGQSLALDLSRALQLDVELGTGLFLPALQELVLEEACEDNAFSKFIDARQDVGRPVRLVAPPSKRDPVAVAPRPRGPNIPSRLLSLDTRVPRSYPASPAMRRLLLPSTAPTSPLSSSSSSTLCSPPLVLGEATEQLSREIARKDPGIDPITPYKGSFERKRYI